MTTREKTINHGHGRPTGRHAVSDQLEQLAANRDHLLADLRRRQSVVRDMVRGVARQYSTGLYLFGRPGTAKTHTVKSVLQNEIREPYVYQGGHLTPVGLFELIAEHPDEVIVLDDLVAIFKSDIALQILLSALEHPTGSDRGRMVKYRRKGETARTMFRGGIICITNRELHDDELLGAFKSRVHTLNYDPSDAQLGALMLDLAERGWPFAMPTVPPEDAREVARYVIAELLRLGLRFDLRLFVDKALPAFQQWRDEETESNWRDLVTASIEEHLVAIRHPEGRGTRAERKEEEHAIVQAILEEHPGRDARIRAWAQRTGKSERAFYRRLAELR
jgi:hypothetical protein